MWLDTKEKRLNYIPANATIKRTQKTEANKIFTEVKVLRLLYLSDIFDKVKTFANSDTEKNITKKVCQTGTKTM